ncbi:MAG: NAD(+)/NADH kinase [Actinobacteria bacterium]|nr:MAG: NAD(+)/NADH kinase [Actinomycetota bacterium]
MKRAVVYTHRRPEETRWALDKLIAAAHDLGVELRFDPAETRKHQLGAVDGVAVDGSDEIEGIDLVFVLGGDGTILTALRRFAGTGVPVFAVNFGQIGFLATVEPDGLSDAFVLACRGEFDLLRLPAITLQAPAGIQAAINDVAIHRRPGERVAMLAYALEGEEVGSVRCDGLVLATPAGSTGYNLANGGPVLAWGVEGYVISFIAPHSLTARPMVAAPNDSIVIHNRSVDEAVDIAVDGRPAGTLEPGDSLTCRFLLEAALLAQLPGSTFYRRLREKFGKLA